jgi:cell division cycle 2-like protein
LSSAGFEVLSGLLESNPAKRLTAAEVLQKPWFQEYCR